jgi:lipopolysaccharide transport system permease protein
MNIVLVKELQSILYSLKHHFYLIKIMIARDVAARYKGSYLGLLWVFVTPLLLLSVYTFFFTVILKSKWPSNEAGLHHSNEMYAMLLFIGMIIHGFFSEAITRAPTIIINNTNYVKKVIFPLEILSFIVIGVASAQMIFNLIILFIALLVTGIGISWTALLLPLVILPLQISCLGIVWFFASLGVYLRDITQATGLIATITMFLSPVFYPASSLPEPYKTIMWLNPLTYVIEDTRKVLIFNTSPQWGWWFGNLVFSMFIAVIGYAWFQKTRKGFSDVI